MPDVTQLVGRATALGEAPIWHDGRVLWVDIYEGAVHATTLEGSDEIIAQVHEPCSAVAPAESGGLVLATRSGVEFFVEGVRELKWRFAGRPTGARLNDGKADPSGRFVVGSMIDADEPPSAELFRLGADLENADVVGRGLSLSNGLAWSPDGGLLYHVDTLTKSVFVHRYDRDVGPTGHVATIDTSAVEGHPDGMTVDVDGCVWIAFWDGGCVARFTPTGQVDRVVEVPVPRPTSVTFAGDDLDVMVITTASFGLDPRALDRSPLSGSLLAIDSIGSGLTAHTVDVASSAATGAVSPSREGPGHG